MRPWHAVPALLPPPLIDARRGERHETLAEGEVIGIDNGDQFAGEVFAGGEGRFVGSADLAADGDADDGIGAVVKSFLEGFGEGGGGGSGGGG